MQTRKFASPSGQGRGPEEGAKEPEELPNLPQEGPKSAQEMSQSCPRTHINRWQMAANPKIAPRKPNSRPPPPIPCFCCLPVCCSAGLHESAQDHLLPCGGVWRDLAGVAVNALVDVDVVAVTAIVCGVVELSEVAWHMQITSCIMDS